MNLFIIYRTVWIRLTPVLRPQSYYSKAWRVTKRLRAGRRKQRANVRAFTVDIWAINELLDFFLNDFSKSTEKIMLHSSDLSSFCVIVWLKQSNYS